MPHEVPSGPPVFINRDPEFRWMERFWDDGLSMSARVAVCTGLPGVGKTAFVGRCVERARATGLFTGGDLYIDFGPEQGERTSVADALGNCLVTLGISPELIPSGVAARANRLRSLTADRAVLIVLDNVTDVAQVVPFVPNSPASAVLVASTSLLRDLELDGAAVLALDPLHGTAGQHMLAEWVGDRARDEPAAVRELVQHCAGLPLVLKIAATQLVNRSGLSVAALATAIAADTNGFGPLARTGRIAQVFSNAYADLDPETARLYRLIGLYPGRDLTAETAAVLAAGDPVGTDTAITTLIERGLLAEDSAGRLSLHSLLRRHAAQLASAVDSEQERDDALRRITEHLLVRAALADRAALGQQRFRCTPVGLTAGYRSPFGDPRKALDWLDSERMNLLELQRAAADRCWHDCSWQLAEALSALYATRRYYADWTVSSGVGAASAAAAGNIRAEARLRSFVSRAWTELERMDRAHDELIVRALPLAEGTGDSRLLGSVWEFIGRYRALTDPAAAVEAYRTSIALFDRNDDDRGTAFVTFFLAGAHWEAGEYDVAEQTMRIALSRIRALAEPDRRMEGRCLIELGRITRETGGAPEARQVLDRAAAVLSASGHKFYEATAHEQLFRLAEQERDVVAMRRALRPMVRIHRELGSDRLPELVAELNRISVPD